MNARSNTMLRLVATLALTGILIESTAVQAQVVLDPPVVDDVLLLAGTFVSNGFDVATTMTASNSPEFWSDELVFISYTPGYGAGPDVTGIPFYDPLWNPETQEFSWDARGSFEGDYIWSVQATNEAGSGTGLIAVRLLFPEPGTGVLVCTAAASMAVFARRRRGRQ
jgi:hypothetical protein